MKTNKFFGPFILLLTAIIWGSAFVAQRSGMDSIEPLTFTAARMILSAVALGIPAIIIGLRDRRALTTADATQAYKKKTKYTLIGGVGCGTFLATATIFQQFGIVETTAGKAGFITALYMLIVPILSLILFRKKGTWLIWLAVVIGVIGMYLLCMNEQFSMTRGDALICVCALLFSGHILFCDHFIGEANPIQMSAVQFATASVISTAAAFIAEQPSWEKIASAAVPILYCGLASGGIAYTLQMVGQKYTDATVASLIMSLESVFAVLAGVIILHERMSLREILGSVILFAAIILVQIPLPKKKEK
ncbi:MAG: DMT family transporter [Ruminococcaceae bacterium]|nr:DMT family transporter [Oscillospiraceae bacterium]